MLCQERKLAYRIDEMPVEKIERIAANKMDERHRGLNALMSDLSAPFGDDGGPLS
jgi:hypothetical protein